MTETKTFITQDLILTERVMLVSKTDRVLDGILCDTIFDYFPKVIRKNQSEYTVRISNRPFRGCKQFTFLKQNLRYWWSSNGGNSYLNIFYQRFDELLLRALGGPPFGHVTAYIGFVKARTKK